MTTPSTTNVPEAPVPVPSLVRRKDRPKKRGASSRLGDAGLAWILIAPSALGFLAFAAYPALRSLYLSFTKYQVLTPATWTGIANYQQMFGDGVFWRSLLITFYYVVLTVAGTMVLSIVTAVIIHRLTKSTFLRGIILLPFLVSNVVAAVVWSFLLQPQLGVVNIILNVFGLPSVQFLGNSHWVIPVLAIITIWKSLGYTSILIFAGLQTIPPTVYEAARVDGASEIQMFRSITLPLLRPIVALVLVLTVIGAFQVFDLVAVATSSGSVAAGGPANASLVLQLYIYNQAFGSFNFGYACTMSIALFVMLLFISFFQMRLLRASESDQN